MTETNLRKSRLAKKGEHLYFNTFSQNRGINVRRNIATDNSRSTYTVYSILLTFTELLCTVSIPSIPHARLFNGTVSREQLPRVTQDSLMGQSHGNNYHVSRRLSNGIVSREQLPRVMQDSLMGQRHGNNYHVSCKAL